MPVDESIHGKSRLLVHDVHGLCIMFHHLAQESGVDPWSSPTRVLYFFPPYATNCLGCVPKSTKAANFSTQLRPSKSSSHRQFSRHVSLSHYPTEEKAKLAAIGNVPTQLRKAHQTGVSRTIADHCCMFPAEWVNRIEILLMHRAVLSSHQRKIGRIDFASGAGHRG